MRRKLKEKLFNKKKVGWETVNDLKKKQYSTFQKIT